MLCFRCGYNNQKSDARIQFCDKCNVRLPEEKKVSPEQKSRADRLDKIVNTADKFIKGEYSSEEFSSFLKKQLLSMEKFEKALQVMNIPKELISEFAPQIDVSLKGIELYKEAIEIMQKSTVKNIKKEKKIELLQEGVKRAQKGNIEVNRSFKMSENKLRQIREETPRYTDERAHPF